MPRMFAFAFVSWLWMKLAHDRFCGFVLGCGCDFFWRGGWKNCNVHDRTMAHRCPWCLAFTDGTDWWAGPTMSTLAQKSSPLVMLFLLLKMQYDSRKSCGSSPPAGLAPSAPRSVLALLAFPVAGFFAVEMFWCGYFTLALDPSYPCFIFYEPGRCLSPRVEAA